MSLRSSSTLLNQAQLVSGLEPYELAYQLVAGGESKCKTVRNFSATHCVKIIRRILFATEPCAEKVARTALAALPPTQTEDCCRLLMSSQ